jgi:AraC family transcriptional regulator
MNSTQNGGARRSAPAVMRAPERGGRLRLLYLYGGVAVYHAGERLAPRVLTDYELVLLIEGRATYAADGRRYDLKPGDVVLARPGAHEAYSWGGLHHARHAYVHFGIETIPSDWPPPADWPVYRRGPDSAAPALMRHLVGRMQQHADWPSRKPTVADNRMVEALIEVLLRPVADAALFTQDRPEPVQHALKWMREVIDEDPGRRVRLADLAAAAHVTGKYLCRVCRRALGHSPMALYRLLRLQLALSLLVRSALSVKEVAERCGFEDALYFSRCFSSAFGVAPRQLRLNLRRGLPPPPNPLPSDVTPRLYWW